MDSNSRLSSQPDILEYTNRAVRDNDPSTDGAVLVILDI